MTGGDFGLNCWVVGRFCSLPGPGGQKSLPACLTSQAFFWYSGVMNSMLRLVLLCFGLMLCSCAYVQTHKRVEEMGSYYEGYLLKSDSMRLFRQGDSWFLSAAKARYKRTFPLVHDSVFRRNNYEPSFELVHDASAPMVYHEISSNAAAILQRSDGYFDLRALVGDMQRCSDTWLEELPGAVSYPIAAHIGGDQSFSIPGSRVPHSTSLSKKALGKLDLVVVDAPLTVGYNVAIPLVAPFVFFYEFLQED